MSDHKIRLRGHADHAWEKRGRCVYCTPCDMRLYAGALPGPGKKADMIEALDGAREALRELVRRRGKRR